MIVYTKSETITTMSCLLWKKKYDRLSRDVIFTRQVCPNKPIKREFDYHGNNSVDARLRWKTRHLWRKQGKYHL